MYDLAVVNVNRAIETTARLAQDHKRHFFNSFFRVKSCPSWVTAFAGAVLKKVGDHEATLVASKNLSKFTRINLPTRNWPGIVSCRDSS